MPYLSLTSSPYKPQYFGCWRRALHALVLHAVVLHAVKHTIKPQKCLNRSFAKYQKGNQSKEKYGMSYCLSHFITSLQRMNIKVILLQTSF